MSLIWVPKRCNYDFKNAKEFGQVKIMLADNQSPFSVNKVRNIFRVYLQDSNSDDYIIPAGPSILSMLLAIEWPHKTMRFLLYHSRTKKYLLREIDNVFG